MHEEAVKQLKTRAQQVRQALAARGVEHFAEKELDALDRELHEIWETLQASAARVQANDAVRDWVIAQLLSEDTTLPLDRVPTPTELLVLKERAREALIQQGVPVAPPKPERQKPEVETTITKTGRRVVTRPRRGALNLQHPPFKGAKL